MLDPVPTPRELLERFRRSRRALVLAAVAVALVVATVADVPDRLSALAPSYVPAEPTARPSPTATVGAGGLSNLTTSVNEQLDRCTPGRAQLARCGQAPPLGRGTWLGTPGGAPVSLDDLRGSVVLVEIFSASCIACRRAARYLTAWQTRYGDAGLRVVGVHSPQFSFETDEQQLAGTLDELGITFPVLQDEGFATLTDYRTRVVPASYLVDAGGTVRAISFGEGGHRRVERQVRALLEERDPRADLPGPVGTLDDGQDAEPGTTPQIDLADAKGRRVDGESDAAVGDDTRFRLPAAQPEGTFSLGGVWRTRTEQLTPRAGAVARVAYRGRAAYQLVSGDGTLTVTTSAGLTRRVQVRGRARLLPVHTSRTSSPETLTIRYEGDLEVYAFSFG